MSGTLQTGERQEAEHLRVTNDSLSWLVPRPDTREALLKRRSVPLSEIQSVEVEKPNEGGTLLLVALAVMMIVGVATYHGLPVQ